MALVPAQVVYRLCYYTSDDFYDYLTSSRSHDGCYMRHHVLSCSVFATGAIVTIWTVQRLLHAPAHRPP